MLKLNIIYAILSVILSYLICNSNEQSVPTSPCPSIFQYAYDGNEWFGMAQLPSIQLGQTIKVNVVLSLKAELRTKYVGALELFGTRQAAIQNIRQRQPIQYRVRFPIQSPLPKLVEIRYNNRVICSGSPETGVVTTIRLEHSLYTELVSQQFPGQQPPTPEIIQAPNVYGEDTDEDYNYQTTYQRPRPPAPQPQTQPQQNNYPQNQPQNPYIPQPAPTQNPYKPQQPPPQNTYFQPKPFEQIPNQDTNPFDTEETYDEQGTVFRPRPSFSGGGLRPQGPVFTQPINNNNNEITQPSRPKPTNQHREQSDEEVCGRTHDRFHFTPLVVGGNNIKRGSWPWLAAIYLMKGVSRSFMCAGSVVSTKVILTAAHCFRTDENTREAHEVGVKVGRFNILEWSEEGSMSTAVESLFIHSDYMKKELSFDADIAVIITKTRIEYNDYIRPICLWEGSESITDIQGMEGTVVGWGRDGHGNIATPEPKQINLPIVSEAECLRSSDAFRYLTSNRTICAGGKDGRGPCNGDSGGAFAMHKNGRWLLRGIVSAALADPVMNSCNLNEYVVFTDTAKFSKWIKSFMNKYRSNGN